VYVVAWWFRVSLFYLFIYLLLYIALIFNHTMYKVPYQVIFSDTLFFYLFEVLTVSEYIQQNNSFPPQPFKFTIHCNISPNFIPNGLYRKAFHSSNMKFVYVIFNNIIPTSQTTQRVPSLPACCSTQRFPTLSQVAVSSGRTVETIMKIT
jgi:hypothetical protein